MNVSKIILSTLFTGLVGLGVYLLAGKSVNLEDLNSVEESAIEGKNTAIEELMAEGKAATTDKTMTRKSDETMKKDEVVMTDQKETVATPSFSGAVLAGRSAPLLDFKKSDYDQALVSGKLVLLYFYANWCPVCLAEFPKMQSAFNKLTTDQLIAFRVNYKDNETDADEISLAKQFGVAYQHTKVFVKNGQLVSKHPDGWEENRYLQEISNRLP